MAAEAPRNLRDDLQALRIDRGAPASTPRGREVGKDLQYIRFNGTIVGGLVGLLLHALALLIGER